MRKLLIPLFILGVCSFHVTAQTVANFTSTTVCNGDSTTLTSTSTSTGTITSVNWDLDSNGTFTDATGAVIKNLFVTTKTSFYVGIQVISNIPDTAVIYLLVNLNPTPVAGFTIDFPTQCLSSNYFSLTNTSTITSGSMTFYWDLDNGTTSTTAIDTGVFYTLAGNKNIMMVAISNNNCRDTIINIAHVVTTNTPDFSINNNSQCASGVFVLTDISAICDTLKGFSWDLNNDGTFGDSMNKSPIYLQFGTGGTYTIGLQTMTNVDTLSVTHNLTVTAGPVTGFTFITQDTQCLGNNSYSLSNTTTGATSYFWDFGDGNTSSATTPSSFSYTSYGTYTIKLVAYNSVTGCNDSVLHDAEVLGSPTVSFTVNNLNQCSFDTFKFVNNSSIIFPFSMTYFWDFGDGRNNTGNDTNLLYTAGSYNVKLIATANTGCADSQTVAINVASGTTANFSENANPQCLNGNSFVLTNTSIICGVLDSVLWDLDSNGVFGDDTGNVITVNYLSVGFFKVGIKVKTTTDSSTTYKYMQVIPAPDAQFTINDSDQVLAVNNFIFTNTSMSSPDVTYFWDYGDGGTSSATSPTYVYGALGTYPVKLIVTDTLTGCMDSVIHNAYVISDITANFTSGFACSGDSVTFTSTSTSGTPITAYDWDFNNDSIFTDASGSTVKGYFPAPGIYTVGLMITNATTTDTIFKAVTINPNPTADFTYTVVCQGLATTLTDNSTITGDSIKSYYWDFDNDLIVDDSGSVVVHTYPLAGIKPTNLILVTKLGCRDTLNKNVQVGFTPVPDFTFTVPCEGDSTEFQNNTVLVNDTILNYLWDYGDGNQAIIKNDPKHLYDTAGTYTVQLIALSTKGCRDTIKHNVTIFPNPNLKLTVGDTMIYKGKSFTVSVIGTYDTVIWSTGLRTNSINISSAGIYSVLVYDANKCTDSAGIEVTVKTVPEILTTDVITPNGDGINDLWQILDLNAFSPVVVTIFNRWGDKIYESTDYKNNWDGKKDGKYVPEGTYYYVIELPDGNVSKGAINVIH